MTRRTSIRELDGRRPWRVVHVDTVHPWDDVRIYHKECRTLARAGWEVHLIAGASVQSLPSDGLVRVQVLPRKSSAWGRAPIQFRALRTSFRLQPDVLHFHSPELIPCMLAVKFLYPSCKVVFDMHENVLALPETRNLGPPAVRRLLRLGLLVLLRLAERTFDAIIIAEESYQRLLRAPGVLVRNYPIVPSSSPIRLPREKQRCGELPPQLVYFGSVSERRGLRIMLEAVGYLRDWGAAVRLDVLGPFAAGTDRDLALTFCADHHLDNWVFFSDGRVPHAEGLRRIAAADVGLCVLQPDPNYVASLPTKLFEYMMMGVPAVVSDFPLWRAIVQDADCGIAVDPTDPGAVARGVKSLLDDPERRTRMGENGRQAVLDKYNWETESRRLLRLYENMGPSPSTEAETACRSVGTNR